MQERGERRVFIIYSHLDKEKVMEIEKGLVDFGIKVLTDYNTINIGENIQEEIKKNIQNVNKILLITSQNSEKSEWIENELEIAKSLNKQILPVIFDDVMPSKLLTGIKYIKLKEINSDTLYPIYLSIKKQYNITN
ncbi:toll/interleukin-1 receptor domain-containing protein [Flavobacterium cupreum]|nr:toll/interleukin-1 receptor domain-containing protein [Flavobacterium cupreum]